MPIRNVCLDEKDQKESQRLMRIAFACHIFNGNIFFVTVIIHLFFTIFITLKSIEEEQKNQPGQDEKDRSRKGRKTKKKKIRRWASRRRDSRKMRKIDQGRGEWMSRLSQGRLSSLSI